MSQMGSGLPSYLKHMTFKPSENTGTLEVNTGTGLTNLVVISNCPIDSRPVKTVLNITASIKDGAISGGAYSRANVVLTNGNLDYWTSISTNQSWEYSDGVFKITSSAYYFAAGVTYDVFWF